MKKLFKKVDMRLSDMAADIKDHFDRTPSFPDITCLDGNDVDFEFNEPSLGHFRTPLGMGIGRDGKLVVADSDNHRLQILNWDGTAEKSVRLGRKRFAEPCCPMDVAVSDDGRFYVTDQANEQIVVGSVEKGVVNVIGKDVPGRPRGIALSKDGYILTTDWWNERYCVRKYAKNGQFVAEFAVPQSDKSSLSWPLFLAVNSKNRIYVSDQGNNRIRVFESDGKFLFDFGNKDEADKLHGPTGIHIDVDDNVYVCDPNRICVLKYDSSGKFLSEISLKPYKYENPYAIAVSRDEPRKIAFTEHRGNHIRMLDVAMV